MSLSKHIDKILQGLPPSEPRESLRGAIRQRLTNTTGVFLDQTTEVLAEGVPEDDGAADFKLTPSISAKYYYSRIMAALQTSGRFVNNTAAAHELDEIANVKRLLEWLSADRRLGDDLEHDTTAVKERLGLAVDPQTVRHLWDPDWPGEPSGITRRILDLVEETAPVAQELDVQARVDEVGDARLTTWRDRQMARCGWEIPVSRLSKLEHPPLSIELSKGCSVGCWFCGVSALKLGGTWPYTDENAELWRGMLTELSTVLGSVRADGFLYWATDPLDNADYERFCLDHAAILGRCPQTTTALALKNVERTRALLTMSRARGCLVDRFSLLTLNQVRKVMDSFTARELLHVKLVLQNPESVGHRSNTGRARDMAAKRGETVTDDAPTACVSGFLINALDRSVQLVTPCRPTDDIPMGYHVLFQGKYQTRQDFSQLIHEMARRLTTSVSRAQRAAFPSCLAYTWREGGFELASPTVRISFSNSHYEPMQELGTLVHQGDRTCQQIATALAERVKPAITLYALEELFKQGLLVEEFKTVDLT